MSAEGLAVLVAQGVAHCPSLSQLWLHGKTAGVCVGVCEWSRACACACGVAP